MLDLKQAVIDGREDDAASYEQEVMANLVELRRFAGEK
jgi:hypothetical protein